MPISDDLRALFYRPEFWVGYFWEEGAPTVGFPDGEAIHLEFGRLGDFAFELQILPRFSEIALYLIHPGRPQGQQLGWDDPAHGHPHVLRWEELDLISRITEKTDMDPDFGHPGLPLLLLCRFAPICLDDDAPAILQKLTRAWRSLDIFREVEFQGYMEFIDRRQDAFRWFEGANGWVLDADPDHPAGAIPPLTFRHEKNAEFPSRPLEEYMKRLRKLVGPSPHQPKDGNVPTLRPRYEVRVTVPEPEPLESRGKGVAGPLNSALREASLGHAGVAGADYVGTQRVSSAVDVQIRGDLARGIEILQKALRDMGAPRDITIEVRFPMRRPIPW